MPGVALTAQLHAALAHLHEPAELETHPLAGPLGGGRALRRALEEAVGALEPERGARAEPNARRRSDLLRLRYLDALPVLEVQRRLLIGQSEYYREHQRALAALAALLRPRLPPSPGRPVEPSDGAEAAGAAGAPAAAPASRLDLAPLPIYLTSFVGRAGDLAAVERLLADGRLLTLVGAGGCGKTRLAVEAARHLVGAFPDGTAFVDLAPLADPALVPRAALAAVGGREQPGRTAEAAIASLLAERRALLVLDNCEHLVVASADLASRLLGLCPRLRILATSREPLRVGGETAWRVPSLPAPADDAAVDAIAGYPAVQLFVERAARVQPGFALTAANAPEVARVCRWLDGIPLALELAAARVAALSPRQLADRLGDVFRLLVAGERGAVPRQRTLRALVDWSYDLLSAPERSLLGRLSVFVGSFALEAAEAVCGGGPVDVLALLPALVDRSLVAAESDGQATRYRLLETMRTYAAERLAASGDGAAARRAHAWHYLSVAEAAEGHLFDRDAPAWLGLLGREHENLRAGLRWALETGDAEAGLRLAVALYPFWRQRGHVREGRTWLTDLLALLPGEPLADGAGRLLRARALNAAGVLARDAGDLAAARPVLSEAVALFEALGEDERLATTRQHLGQVLLRQGEYPHARVHLEASLAGLRRLGDARVQIGTLFACLVALALLALQERRLGAATAYVAEAEARARRAGSPHVVAQALTMRGILHVERGEHAAAGTALREALEQAAHADATLAVLDALHALASAAAARGDPHLAAVLEAAHSAAWSGTGIGRVMEHAALQGRLRAALAGLDPDARAAAAAEGAAMTVEQAVARALGDRVD